MEKINSIVGENLKNIRKDRNLTLQEMSDITGVSKSMLGEIERSVSSPTITVLWKIVSGLKIPFTHLLQDQKVSVIIVKSSDQDVVTTDDAFKITPIFNYESEKKFETYSMTFPAFSKGDIKNHNKGIVEYLFVYKGELVVEIGDTEYNVNTGDSIRFFADSPHRYINKSDEETKVYSIMYYGNTD